jgi:hypothetical protein
VNHGTEERELCDLGIDPQEEVLSFELHAATGEIDEKRRTRARHLISDGGRNDQPCVNEG